MTLIQNLETYGINPEKIAHHVQVAVAASTSISPAPNGKGTLVLIQGNQVIYLQKLFLSKLLILIVLDIKLFMTVFKHTTAHKLTVFNLYL